MVKYVVRDNYGEIGDFKTYEDAKDFAKRYVDIDAEEMEKLYGACGITFVKIVKEIYNKRDTKGGITIYDFIEDKELEILYV